MKLVKIGMVGFGNVGHGFIQALVDKKDFFRKELGLDFVITAITDIRYGTIYDQDGLPLKKLVRAHDFSEMDPSFHKDWNTIQMIRNAESDVIIELSFTDLKTGEPAVLHCQEALLSGKHVITSNKGPIALHYNMLKGLARDNGVKIGCEGTVMSGTPALRLALDSLLPAGINEIHGILNGTTNFIITQMENGSTYEEALKEAQLSGYAEADPSGDVEGFDTAGKVAILSHLVFGTFIKPEDIEREGITDLTIDDIQEALKNNMHWKLIGSVKKTPHGVKASVKPVMLPNDNPLAGIKGAGNAIQYHTDLLGEITLVGPGAGRKETAAALIEDLIHIMQ
jgi:homoserine dehydrogenase